MKKILAISIMVILSLCSFAGCSVKEEDTPELSVTFFELGNGYAGDCTLIKTDNTEVLIDAGSTYDSAKALVPEIKKLCTDDILEYVIVTHNHMDHITALYGTKDSAGIFDCFKCGTIIDFSNTHYDYGTPYKQYVEKRDKQVANGARHYTALECCKQENGVRQTYSLAKDTTLKILYQGFYEQESYDENNYSVCVLVSHGNNNMLFTGDLEKDGEAELIKCNDLPKCGLYKASHHGSTTANGEELLSEIQPEIVVVPCCAGASEYYHVWKDDKSCFPQQGFCDRIAKYTDKVYIPLVATNVNASLEEGKSTWEYAPMNGKICVTSNGEELKVNCSNNDIPLFESEWYLKDRATEKEDK